MKKVEAGERIFSYFRSGRATGGAHNAGRDIGKRSLGAWILTIPPVPGPAL